jgi:hypothetical protein
MNFDPCFSSQLKARSRSCGRVEAKLPRCAHVLMPSIFFGYVAWRHCNALFMFTSSITFPPFFCFQLMSDFLDITEEQQHEMLSASETSTKAPGTSRRRQIAGAAEKFVRLNCKARDLFRRGVGLNTLDDIEQRVIAFLSANDSDRIDCEDMLTPMQRLVAHAVAEFHCCTSRTNSHPDGTRSM